MRFPFDPKTSDDEIAGRIVQLFRWDVSVPDDRIQVAWAAPGVTRVEDEIAFA